VKVELTKEEKHLILRHCSSEEKSIDRRIQNVGESLMPGWQAVGPGLATELLSVDQKCVTILPNVHTIIRELPL
jgi:hypothetical protein